MPAQPQIIGGTIGSEGASTAGAAADIGLLSVSAIGANTTADRWWKFTPSADVSVNFDAMLSFTATSTRDSLDPGITISVYQAGDLVTPIVTASSGVDPQQGAVARGSVAVVVEAGVTYHIALTGVADSYRILRVSGATDVSPWLTIPDAEYVQVIAPDGMTIEPDNWVGSYDGTVARSNKAIEYGVTPPFAGPPVYEQPGMWDCMWEGHLIPCYVEVDGQLWNNPVTDIEWTGSGVCKVSTSPGAHTVGADVIGPTVAWSNRTDTTGHAYGKHTGTGYLINNAALLADDPGPSGLGDFPDPPPGAVIEIENEGEPGAVLSLEIALTDDGTGDGEVAVRRFNGGYGADDTAWWLGVKPDGELIISHYDGTVNWEPFTLDEEDATTDVVGYTQWVEDNATPPGPGVGDVTLSESRAPELAFRLTWSPHRYRIVYPPVVPPTITGFPPLRIFGRSDGATNGPRRVLGGGNTRQGGPRTLGSIL